MKHKIILAFILLLAVGLNSCNKENSTTANYPDFSNCKVNRLYDATSEQKFTYNVDGKISKIEEFESGSLTSALTYTHSGSSVSYESETGREKGNYELDANGRAVSSTITYYRDMDPTKATSGVISTYKYNAAGNLIESNEAYSSQAGTTNYLNTYTWANGNLKSEISVSSLGSSTITNFEYYTDKSNALGKTQTLTDFTGVPSKNLLKKQIDGKDGSQIASFTYGFNSSGKPIKIIQDGLEKSIELSCL